MKTIFTSFLVIATALICRAALPQPDLVAQIHFAGGANLAADKNYSTFAPQFSSAEAKALRAQTADKLAKFFAGWLAQTTGTTVNSGSARLRPLLEELQNNEWQLEAHNVNGKLETALALKTGDAGAQICQTALKPFFPAATFERANGWIFFRTGVAAPKIASKLSALNGAWLTVDLNWPTLGNYFPSVRELGLPETQFTVDAGATDFKISGQFLFPENIVAPMDAWRVPTNTLHQPFISFTAVRGLSAWLDSQPWTRPFHLNPTPNQIYFWALPQIPWQAFAAIPCTDSAATLLEVYDNLANVFTAAKSKNEMAFPCTVEQTNRQVTVVGLPFVAPYFEAVKSSAGEFLLAAGFPNTPRSSKPLPPELFTRLAQQNLLFYHWEITAERMATLLQASQFALMVSWHKQLGENSAALKWLQQIEPKLGNSVTEVFQSAPDQMTFTRKGPSIFTAVELFALGNWLEADNFPGCDLKMPPRNPKFKRHSLPATPAPGS